MRYLIFTICLLLNSGANSVAQHTEWGQWSSWGDQRDGTYRNPILPADFSDIDCIRVRSDYYAISSTMQYSPGMVILHSRDLVNWQICGHVIEDLTRISPELNWNKMNRYGRGIWAGSIRYHGKRFYIVFGTPDEGYFITTATQPEGPWTPLHPLLKENGWDDCCIDWDEKGQPWFVGTNFKDGYKTWLFRMSADARSIDRTSAILLNEGSHREANKLLYHDGWHYLIFSEHNSKEGRYVMAKRSRHMTGPYEELRQLTRNTPGDMEPNQGGIVQGPNGHWYFLTHHGRGSWEGRGVSLLPVTWADGWPLIGTIQPDGVGTMTWKGDMPRKSDLYSYGLNETFSQSKLSQALEWNYQPRQEMYSLTERRGWLRMKAFIPLFVNDFRTVGNILTTRVFRTRTNRVTTHVDISGLANGAHAGLCHFSKQSARIGIARTCGQNQIEFYSNGTSHTGPIVTGKDIWLRTEWGQDGQARFSYSLNGRKFFPFGDIYPLQWASYRGDRVGIYCYNDSAEQGHADFDFLTYSMQAEGR